MILSTGKIGRLHFDNPLFCDLATFCLCFRNGVGASRHAKKEKSEGEASAPGYSDSMRKAATRGRGNDEKLEFRDSLHWLWWIGGGRRCPRF